MMAKYKEKKYLLHSKGPKDQEFAQKLKDRMLKILKFDDLSLKRVLGRILLDVKAIVSLGYKEHDTYVLDDEGNLIAMYYKKNGDKCVSSIQYNINILEYKGD